MFESIENEMIDASIRHVFVYGTLRRGDDNDINLLSPSPHFVGAGTVGGVMYHLGDYPGVLLNDAPQHNIVGEVYAIAPELEKVLDEIEMIYPQQHDEYSKCTVIAMVEARQISCLFYEINAAYVADRPVIATGDWIKGR